jgi:hypothetical protein
MRHLDLGTVIARSGICATAIPRRAAALFKFSLARLRSPCRGVSGAARGRLSDSETRRFVPRMASMRFSACSL